MNTVVLSITDAARDRDKLSRAADILRSGGLAAFPTETVYGLGANGLDTEAVGRIFMAKGRPQDNPLILHIADAAGLDMLCRDIPDAARRLAEHFWPGPLTMVLPKKDSVPDIVTAGLDTVAVRVPAHETARALIRAAGVPIAAPSANLSGGPSPTAAAHVLRDLGGRIDCIVDAGPCAVGLESTVVSLYTRPCRLLRPGGVTAEAIREILPELVYGNAAGVLVDTDEPVRSPGMKYRHYATRAPIRVVTGAGHISARVITGLISAGEGYTRPAVLCYNEYERYFPGITCVSFGPEHDCGAQAAGLFDALRRLDDAEPDIIFAQCPEERGLGLAIANRIKKAAGFDIIEVDGV